MLALVRMLTCWHCCPSLNVLHYGKIMRRLNMITKVVGYLGVYVRAPPLENSRGGIQRIKSNWNGNFKPDFDGDCLFCCCLRLWGIIGLYIYKLSLDIYLQEKNVTNSESKTVTIQCVNYRSCFVLRALRQVKARALGLMPIILFVLCIKSSINQQPYVLTSAFVQIRMKNHFVDG